MPGRQGRWGRWAGSEHSPPALGFWRAIAIDNPLSANERRRANGRHGSGAACGRLPADRPALYFCVFSESERVFDVNPEVAPAYQNQAGGSRKLDRSTL
jgi:hypothetical protein